MMNGIVNIYKEKGFTSHDVVAKLRGMLKQKKIGHTGTLDPDAEGVLPVCLGKATKVCDLLTDKDKTYRAKLLLGVETDTQDITGTVLAQKEVTVTEEQVREAIESFVGSYDQVPPMYSALKVNGKKLYELARAGIEVERKSRTVTILSIDILEINLPYVVMDVSCSKGTYIRTLCQDIGQKLGCGGCMSELLRTQVGDFRLEDSMKLSQVQQLVDNQQVEEALIPVDALFENYKKIVVKKTCDRMVYNGNAVRLHDCVDEKTPEMDKVRIYDSAHRFIGVYQWKTERKMYVPVKIFWETK